MELEKKKKPSKKPKNYKGYSKAFPQFAFRVPSGAKAKAKLERVKKNLVRLHEHFKTTVDQDEVKIINKNDILLEALDRGLMEMINKKDLIIK